MEHKAMKYIGTLTLYQDAMVTLVTSIGDREIPDCRKEVTVEMAIAAFNDENWHRGSFSNPDIFIKDCYRSIQGEVQEVGCVWQEDIAGNEICTALTMDIKGE